MLNAGQKYCRMLQGEHSAILLTFIKVPFVIKIFVLSIFVWPFYTGFTVHSFKKIHCERCGDKVLSVYVLKFTKMKRLMEIPLL